MTESSEASPLIRLGFAPSDVVAAREAYPGRLLVPGTLGTEPVHFAIDTGTVAPIVLSLTFAETQGLVVLGEQLQITRASGQPKIRMGEVLCSPLEVLGRSLPAAPLPVADLPRFSSMQESLPDVMVAGSIGTEFFCNGYLGLDFAHPSVAFAEEFQLDPNGWEPALFELPFVLSEGGSIFLLGIRDGVAGEELTMYLDSGVYTSALAYDALVSRLPRRGVFNRLFNHVLRWRFRRNIRSKERRIPWSFDFSSEHEEQLGVWLHASLKAQAAAHGLDRVDGYLGSDILRNRVAILDFPQSTLRVYPASKVA